MDISDEDNNNNLTIILSVVNYNNVYYEAIIIHVFIIKIIF